MNLLRAGDDRLDEPAGRCNFHLIHARLWMDKHAISWLQTPALHLRVNGTGLEQVVDQIVKKNGIADLQRQVRVPQIEGEHSHSPPPSFTREYQWSGLSTHQYLRPGWQRYLMGLPDMHAAPVN